MTDTSPKSAETFITAQDGPSQTSISRHDETTTTPRAYHLTETSRHEDPVKDEHQTPTLSKHVASTTQPGEHAHDKPSNELNEKTSLSHDASPAVKVEGLGITFPNQGDISNGDFRFQNQHDMVSAADDVINEKAHHQEEDRGRDRSQEPGYFGHNAVEPGMRRAETSPDPEEKLPRAAAKPFAPDDISTGARPGVIPKEAHIYKYDALPSSADSRVIRVIDIVPRHESPLLTLRMRTVDLADHPSYEAISYCWGAPVFDRKVLIDGKGVLAITTSLDGVLRQLRDDDKVRTVWADAVCINQKDIEERNSQVQLMRDIYRESKRVIAWLGTATTESDVGMDVVPKVIAALRKKQMNHDPRLLRHVPDAVLIRYGFPQRNSLALKCLFGIFARPWFRRVWIIQELALAPDALLLCGDKTVRWDFFQTATYECWGNLVTFTESNDIKSGWYFADSIIQPTKQELGSGVTPHLINLVARSSVTFATDPRDKVFALIGLSKERGTGQGVLGAPDYHLPVEEVYTNFTIENIRTYRNLDVLSLAHHPLVADEPKPLDLPSWVPSFSTLAASDPLTGIDQVTTVDEQGNLTHFNATYHSVAMPRFSDNNRRICLQGHIVDVVVVTGDLMHHQMEIEDKIAYSQRVHNTFSSWEHVSGARSGKRHPLSPIASEDDKGESLLDVYWQVINGGLIRSSAAETHEAFENDYLAPIKAYRLASAGQTIKNRNCFQIVERVAGWMQDVQNWWRVQWGDHPAEHLVVPGISNCRRVGKTQTHRVCLLPGDCRAGDQIALLSGSKVPYVIRKEENQDLWTLVGEAYVHGIMFGEAWKEDNCHDICLI